MRNRIGPRVITRQEHLASPGFLAGPGQNLARRGRAAWDGDCLHGVVERLSDLDALRLREMDEAGIDVQVLSLTPPGTEQLEGADAVSLAREVHAFAAEAVARHPDRLAALAASPRPCRTRRPRSSSTPYAICTSGAP